MKTPQIPDITKALKVYNMWIKHWPRDKKGALQIAEDFIDNAKQRKAFQVAISQ